MEPPKAQS
jgi:hypothetical protein